MSTRYSTLLRGFLYLTLKYSIHQFPPFFSLPTLSTLQISSTYKQQLGEAIATQSARMAQAVTNEKNRKAAAAAEASRKRSISALSEEATEAKRQKMDNGASTASVASVLANFDFSILPHTLVTELIIANLQALTEQSLTAAINVNRNLPCLFFGGGY